MRKICVFLAKYFNWPLFIRSKSICFIGMKWWGFYHFRKRNAPQYICVFQRKGFQKRRCSLQLNTEIWKNIWKDKTRPLFYFARIIRFKAHTNQKHRKPCRKVMEKLWLKCRVCIRHLFFSVFSFSKAIETNMPMIPFPYFCNSIYMQSRKYCFCESKPLLARTRHWSHLLFNECF